MTRYGRGAWAVTASFPPGLFVVRQARRLAQAAMDSWGVVDPLRLDAEIVVSELVSNAVQYGQGPVDLAIALTRELLRITVSDTSLVLPRARAAGPDAQSGRGLRIVEELVTSWEVVSGLGGKTITCALPADGASLLAAFPGTEAAADPDRQTPAGQGQSGQSQG